MKQEPLMTLFVTPNEVVAVGDAIYAYSCYLRSKRHITEEEQERARLLERFHRRIVVQQMQRALK